MGLQKLKINRPALTELARDIKMRFPQLAARVFKKNQRVIIQTARTDYFTAKEIELLAKNYFPTHQIRLQLSRHLN